MKNALLARCFFPVNYFGVALGTLALALAWRYGSGLGLVSHWAADTLGIFALVCWLILLASYILRWAFDQEATKAECQNMILCCFVSLIPVTAIEGASVLMPYSTQLAWVIAIAGIVGQLAFAAYRTPHLWMGNHTPAATTPIIYLPAVAANFATAAFLGQTGHTDYGWLFLGAGILSWFSLESVILHRLRTEPQVAPETRGALGIQVAPPFVGAVALLSLNGGRADVFVLMMAGYGLLQVLYFARLLPWLLGANFTMGLWGFSFGLAAMANVGAHLIHAHVLVGLGYGMFWGGSLIIALLWAGNFIKFARSFKNQPVGQ